MLSKGEYKNDLKQGRWTENYTGGELFIESEYTDGQGYGTWKYYFLSGPLQATGRKVSNNKTGQWKIYNIDSQLIQLGNYLNDVADGEWKIYHSNGEVHHIRLWENGKLMDILSVFDGAGNRMEKGTLINGNGTLNLYDLNGDISEVWTIIDGEIQK